MHVHQLYITGKTVTLLQTGRKKRRLGMGGGWKGGREHWKGGRVKKRGSWGVRSRKGKEAGRRMKERKEKGRRNQRRRIKKGEDKEKKKGKNEKEDGIRRLMNRRRVRGTAGIYIYVCVCS